MPAHRIGIVTGGGDCPGLNAVIRAVAKATHRRGWETVGILGGYDGLLEPQRYRPLDYRELGGLLLRGGTILGTSNRGRFAAKVGHGEAQRIPAEVLDAAKRGCETLGLSALVTIGGDGSLSIAQQLHEHGIPIVGVPKTIDNDLAATAMTFGFDSAVACATDAVDRLHTTAESHQRVMVLEVAAELERRTGKEARTVVLGHLQRGGAPTNFDRALCTVFGTTAVELIASGAFGRMVTYTGAGISSVALHDAVGHLRRVPLDGGFVRSARALGICLGD